MKKYTSVVFSFLFVLSSFPRICSGFDRTDNYQPGYIVTLKNDTLKGFILMQDHSFNSMNCVFKTEDGNKKTFSPNEAKSYAIGNLKYYLSYNVGTDGGTQMVFLECIIKGSTSLFYFQDRFFLQSKTKMEELILQKKDIVKEGKTYTLKVEIYKGTLQKELSDCNTLSQTLQKTTFGKKSLTELFLDYYKCTGQESTFYESGSEKISTQFGLVAGTSLSNLNITAGGPNAYYDKLSPLTNSGITASLMITFSAQKYRLRLRTGLTYYGNSYKGYYEQLSAGYSYALTVEVSRLEIPLILKYHLFRNNKGLYVLGGIGVNTFLTWTNTLVTNNIPPSSSVATSPLINKSLFINFMGGLGYEFPIGNRTLFVEGLYGIGPAILKTEFPSGSISAINLTAGITF